MATAQSETTKKGPIIAEEFIEGIDGVMRGIQSGETKWWPLPDLEYRDEFSKACGLSVWELLFPKIARLLNSEDAEQMKALGVLLEGSKELLALTPSQLSHTLASEPDGSYFEMRNDEFVLRLPTNIAIRRGQRVYYALTASRFGLRVSLRQRLQTRDPREFAPRNNVVPISR
jgi:hypothetical protein